MEGLKHASGLQEEVSLTRDETPNCYLCHGAEAGVPYPCISGTLTHSRFSTNVFSEFIFSQTDHDDLDQNLKKNM